MSFETFPKCLAFLSFFLCGVLLVGCLRGEIAQTIGPENTSWIQKGTTTKEQIINKFGLPNLTMPISGQPQNGTHVEYNSIRTPDEYPGGNLISQLDPRPQGSLPQVYRQPIDRIPYSTGKASRKPPLWIRYNAQGVVQEFGFGKASYQ